MKLNEIIPFFFIRCTEIVIIISVADCLILLTVVVCLDAALASNLSWSFGIKALDDTN